MRMESASVESRLRRRGLTLRTALCVAQLACAVAQAEDRGSGAAEGSMAVRPAPEDLAEITHGRSAQAASGAARPTLAVRADEAMLIHASDADGLPDSEAEPQADTGASLTGPLPMFGAIVLQRVKDYDAWRAVFDDLLPQRRQAGFAAQGIMRGVDDARLVAVWLAVTDVAQAKTFFRSAAVRAREARAGLLSRSQVRLSSNVVARMEPGRRGLHAALVALRVDDLSRFSAAFANQGDARARAGIVGYALSQDVDDARRAYVYLQSESAVQLRKYISAVETRQRWRDAGMLGNPSVTLVREGELTLCK